MLISRRGNELQLVNQSDHGVLAGALAAQWGNDDFIGPSDRLRAALTLAATAHDDGWRELDEAPAWNADAGRPAHFLELDLADTVGPYGRGVDSVYARDPLAGALVSMHWAGLYSSRWGLQGGAPVGHPLAEEVMVEQDARHTAAVREAWNLDGLRSTFEAEVWRAYEMLQALDFISLALSLADLSRPSDTTQRPLPMPVTLKPIGQPPGPRVVPAVPRGTEHSDVTVLVREPYVVTLDPWPFGRDSFEVEAPARMLPDRRYDSPAAAMEAARPARIHATVTR